MLENQETARLTIEDIEKKEFKRVAYGYEQRAVDEFLDSICDEIELLQGEVAELKRKLAMADAQARQAEASGGFVRPAASGAQDASFREILEMAQRVKEQTIADAQARAAEIVAKAETEANARIGGLAEEKEKLEAALSTLKASASAYREKFAQMISEHQAVLESVKLDD